MAVLIFYLFRLQRKPRAWIYRSCSDRSAILRIRADLNRQFEMFLEKMISAVQTLRLW